MDDENISGRGGILDHGCCLGAGSQPEKPEFFC